MLEGMVDDETPAEISSHGRPSDATNEVNGHSGDEESVPAPDAADDEGVTETGSFPIPTRSIDHLLHPPRHLSAIRQRLFDINEKIELRPDEFELYWPYVDNVWVRQHRAGKDKSGRLTTEYYACRLQRPTYIPRDIDKRPEGKPSRKKQIREGGTCQMRLKTIRYDGGYTSYMIFKVGDQLSHTHDLDRMDQIKRPSILMDIARAEVMKGYMPASVFTILIENMEKLAVAGGRHLSRNDVRNASQAWRQQHRGELKVHEGYKYDHGNGIVREEEAVEPMPLATNGDPSTVDPVLAPPPGTLRFPAECRTFLEPYLPRSGSSSNAFPHVTLTYAASMDSSISLMPGVQTVLSGPESKAMTHYLRSRHDAILIGVGTALADDPGLNCRLEGVGGFGGLGWEGQPRPVVIDPGARWPLTPSTRILKTVQEGKGKGPWVVIAPGFSIDPARLELLKYYGGKYLGLTDFDMSWRLRWEAILTALAAEGIKSVMIEGGGRVINGLLQPEHSGLISSVIVTMAPTYLGEGGVTITPPPARDQAGKPQPAQRFQDVKWQPLGNDVVMCGRLQKSPSSGDQGPASQFRTVAA